MAHLILRVEIDDDYAQHCGIAALAEDVMEYAMGCDSTYRYAVVEVEGPEGHACFMCGGATHPGQECTNAGPPEGVAYASKETDPWGCALVEGCRG